MNKPDLLEIIEREGIEVKRHGHRYSCLCPLHDERSPSFKINTDRQQWHCFGCNEHGDVIDLIMKLHGLNFKDACRYLGIMPGKPAPIDPAIQRRRTIQKRYETAMADIWEKICSRSRALYRLKTRVEKNPGALTDAGAAVFAERMGELATTENKLDTLSMGNFEEKIRLMGEIKNVYCSGKT